VADVILKRLIFFLLLTSWLFESCRQKQSADYVITDFTKPQRFTFVTNTNRSEIDRIVTINGKINGCSEIAYFYTGWDTTYVHDKNQWPKNTITINDSISFRVDLEEGSGSKHDFFFLPGDANNGKITISIREL
jgi:hypothetical protein